MFKVHMTVMMKGCAGKSHSTQKNSNSLAGCSLEYSIEDFLSVINKRETYGGDSDNF